MKETWMKPKTKVTVGLFEGTIVRVIEWHGEVLIDVEIGGVIERHKAAEVAPAQR